MYDINKEIRFGNGGELLILSPGSKIVHGSPKDSGLRYIDDWIIVSGEHISTLLSELRLPMNVSFDIGDARFIAPYITRIRNELNVHRMGRHCIASNIIGEMLVAMGRQYEHVLNMRLPQKYRIECVRVEMLANYRNEWTLKTLADMAGYSQSYFCALYQKFYGISPIDDLLAYRINIAKNELARRKCSITDISEKCGFTAIHHFSRYFKKYVGVSPSGYSKQMPKTVAE
ncbi:MAG: helix-turn-helix transcriptional regulator [Clostridia bacterium]|nr:helix-turn-helix transcriptional regulator [Clostridia bacterium]